ncbi:MAG: NCS2 family permease [Sedimentisphaerales bacterium]|nr:NCS2 family permease [Sedimentisphaerales bacterium]
MIDKYFKLSRRQTDFKIECMAGLTTFLTMAYIIFTNPDILSDNTGMDREALIAVTCIVSAVATISVGLFANAPIAMAPGMGLNAFFAYSLVLGDKVPWETALGVVFLSGLFFLVLSLLGLRKKLVEAIPPSLVSAISVGIGLFITFIGLKNLGVIVQGSEATLVKAGQIKATVLIGMFGLIIMLFLEIIKTKGALLIGIISSTALAAILGYTPKPEQWITSNLNLSAVAFRLDIIGALKWSLFGSIFTLMFIDMFDSVGTLVACCHQANMVDEKNRIKGLGKLLGLDAVATMAGALLGTSTTTAYIESAAGIEEGGRTGLTSIVTGIFFLLALVFVPIVKIVPSYAAAPALIMVGLFMMKEVKRIDFTDLSEAFPSFIIMVMIALSYSISTGLAFGFISFAMMKVISGKIRDVKPAMWIIASFSLLFLTLEQIPNLVEHIKSFF